MMKNFALNYVCVVFFIMSLQKCLNVENNIEKDDDIVPVTADIYSSSNSTNEKIVLRIDYYTKNENNTSDNRDVVHYTNISNITSESKEDDREKNCNDCIRELLKRDINSNSKGFEKVNDQSNSSKRNLAITLEKKRETSRIKHNSVHYQHKESIPKDLLNIQENRTSHVFVVENNKVDVFTPEKPVLRAASEANLGDFPYQISFKKLRFMIPVDGAKRQWVYFSFCSGIIIGPTKLLSAARCFEHKYTRYWPCLRPKSRRADKMNLHRILAIAGSNSHVYDGTGQMRLLKSMYYPHTYKFPNDDICVGYVTEPYKFDAHINQVPYEKTFVDYNKTVCLMSGHGHDGTYFRHEIIRADLTTLSNKECSKLHHKKMNDFICTDNAPLYIQKGSPLACSGTLVGIHIDRGKSGSLFTRVSSYREWIAIGKATTMIHNHLVHFIHVCFVIFTIERLPF